MQCKIRIITGLLLLSMAPIIFFGYHVAQQTDVLRRSHIMKGKELYTRNQVTPLLGYREDLPKSVANELRENLKLAKQTKVILLWYKPWGVEYNPVVVDDDQCGKCKVVLNRSEISNPDTAIVVFHWIDVNPKTMPTPRERRTNQLHVWWCSEPPTYVKYCQKRNLNYEDGYQFNATMNYRRDSDVWGPYWNAENLNRAANRYVNHSDILKRKSKFALAMVSDCDEIPSAKDRLKLLQQFKLDKQVDLMGKCFGSRYEGTIDEYKFFFAFENSHHCRDYLTEKPFENSLLRGIVPVVWGATSEDYRRFMPKESYILAEDYSTVEDLLEYMHFLDQNDDAYMSYFRWRLEDQNMDNDGIGPQNGWCSLCRMAHGINVDDVLYSGRRNEEKEKLFTKSILPRTVPSLSQWFYGTENEECLHVYK